MSCVLSLPESSYAPYVDRRLLSPFLLEGTETQGIRWIVYSWDSNPGNLTWQLMHWIPHYAASIIVTNLELHSL